MPLFTAIILVLYIGTPFLSPRLGPQGLSVLALAEELGLDLIAILAATQLARVSRAYRWIQWSFICAALSSINYQVLGIMGIDLAKARGTWLEIEINVPYVLFFVLGVVALQLLSEEDPKQQCRRNGAIYAGLITAVAAYVLVPLLLEARPLWQTRIIHLVCMSAAGCLLGYGLHALLNAPAPVKLIAAGYMSLACSNLLFQLVEVFTGKLHLDRALDWTWTGGQAGVVIGLLLARRLSR